MTCGEIHNYPANAFPENRHQRFPGLPSEMLSGIEANITKYNIGVFVAYVEQFYLLTGIYGEDACIRILGILKDTIRSVFDHHFQNCRIIYVQNDQINQNAVWFTLPDSSIPSLPSYSESARISLADHIVNLGFRYMASHLDIAAGYSWIPKNNKQNLRETCFKTYCDANRSAIFMKNTGLLRIHQEFLHILEHCEFRIFFTPVIQLLSGDIAGWDVFVTGPEKSFFNTMKTLYQYAEETGNLFAFQMKMVSFVFQNLTDMACGAKIFLHIHLKTILDPLFNIQSVIDLFKQYRVRTDNAVFKFSERQCYGNQSLLIQNLEYCRQFGCGVLLDEVGAGGLSLGSIAEIKPGFVKIDTSLVKGLEHNPVQRVITEGYCQLARKIGARIIADGIETPSELYTLTVMGVEWGQGPLIYESDLTTASLTKIRSPMSLIVSEKTEVSDNSVPLIDLVQPAIQAPPHMSVEEIKDLLKNSPPMSSVVIVNDLKPMGLLMKYNIDRKLGARFGVSLYYQREANRLMDTNPLIVEKHQPLEQVARLAMSRSPQNIYDDIIVTDNGLLVGTVSVQKMLETLSEVALKERDAAKADNKRIKDSLRYAKLIQKAMLPTKEKLQTYFSDSFCIWMPRDIVGGDMVLLEPYDDGFTLAVMDCTGHGVPGAFMTMIAGMPLRRLLTDNASGNPAGILEQLNGIVRKSLHQDSPSAISDDGLDAAICAFNRSDNTLTYAGARFPLCYIHENAVHIIKGDKQSIGYTDSNLNYHFTNHRIPVLNDMQFYFYTDGAVDQLGGKDRLPFGGAQFRNLLLQISNHSCVEQEDIIIETLRRHKGQNDQQDDITVIGFRL